MNTTTSTYKSGFAVLVGRSNVGKSTLLNALVGSKVAITTPKPQTTRFPIQGIVSRPEGQVVFVDTPGVLKDTKDALANTLMANVKESLKDVDLILYVVDPTRSIGEEEKAALRLIEHIEKPKILVINKIDEKMPYRDYYLDMAANFSEVVEVSALRGTHAKTLIDRIFSYLPPGEAYYPEGQLTSLGNEVWTAELIREKLFLRLRQEIPYTIHVEVEAVERRDNGVLYIKANIFTTDERYKRIIIGAGGRGIKEIGQATRKELEMVMQVPIFLDLNVEVDPFWMNKFLK
ncbi:GTPase Era [Candidatus Uhrbacteria bacterium]|nr:GTPase Era [Candidatus Uhrbacteria bacterium]